MHGNTFQGQFTHRRFMCDRREQLNSILHIQQVQKKNTICQKKSLHIRFRCYFKKNNVSIETLMKSNAHCVKSNAHCEVGLFAFGFSVLNRRCFILHWRLMSLLVNVGGTCNIYVAITTSFLFLSPFRAGVGFAATLRPTRFQRQQMSMCTGIPEGKH